MAPGNLTRLYRRTCHRVNCLEVVLEAIRTPALGVVLAIVMGFAACGGGTHGTVVARVEETAITKATVDHWLSVMTGGRATLDPSKRQYQALLQQTLGFLISSEWTIGEAAEEGLKVSEQEIEQRLEEKTSDSFPGGEAEFHAFLKGTGQTVPDVKFKIEAELASSKLRRMVAGKEHEITKVQIATYYSQNKRRFAVPEQRKLEIVNRKSAAAASKLRRDVELGKSFASIARTTSVERASNASRGKRNALERAIYSAKPNVLTGPVQLRVNYYLFEVKGIRVATYRTPAQVQSSIEKQLADEQRRRTLAEFVKGWRKKWIARTDCRAGYVVPDCEQYKGPIAPEAGI